MRRAFASAGMAGLGRQTKANTHEYAKEGRPDRPTYALAESAGSNSHYPGIPIASNRTPPVRADNEIRRLVSRPTGKSKESKENQYFFISISIRHDPVFPQCISVFYLLFLHPSSLPLIVGDTPDGAPAAYPVERMVWGAAPIHPEGKVLQRLELLGLEGNERF